MWQGLNLINQCVNRWVALSPNRVSPSPNLGIVSLTDQACRLRKIACQMCSGRIAQEFCGPENLRDRLTETALCHAIYDAV
jgi:hypothetical protein